jgi:hypothetical protein
MNEKTHTTQDHDPPFELSQKEKVLEFLAVALCLMLLLGCFLKVMFF